MTTIEIPEGAARFLYLTINLFIFVPTFALSFERRVAFRKRWPAMVPAYMAVSVPFIVWDMLMIKHDHWGFERDYILGWRLFHAIPLEEVLFFFTVPYACIFTYEAIKAFMPRVRVPFHRAPFIVLGGSSIITAIFFLGQPYTASVLIAFGIVLIVAAFISPEMFRDAGFYVFLLAVIILFVVFNYLLTAIPIVWYSPGSIWGGDGAWNGRFITIPYEDFIYNLALLIGFLAVYHRFRNAWTKGPEHAKQGASV